MTIHEMIPEPQLTLENNPPPSMSPPKCRCTALMARARFMSNGWKHTPCDGTFCAFRRQENEVPANCVVGS